MWIKISTGNARLLIYGGDSLSNDSSHPWSGHPTFPILNTRKPELFIQNNLMNMKL